MTVSRWVWLQRLLPQKLLCRIVYLASRSQRHWLKSALIGWFVRQYGIDVSEAAEPDIAKYPSFNAFFTRELRPGARPVTAAPGQLVSPVDGRLTTFGQIRQGQLLQAKGFSYTPEDLLRPQGEMPAGLRNGQFATIYLAPTDYHRIHVPLDCTLTALHYIAGARYSVNAATASSIDRLFCRNERLVCWFDSAYGRFALALIGALNVSSFSTVVTGEIPSGRDQHWPAMEPLPLLRSAPFAAFNLGSTVIMVMPAATMHWDAGLVSGQKLLLGQPLGTGQLSGRSE